MQNSPRRRKGFQKVDPKGDDENTTNLSICFNESGIGLLIGDDPTIGGGNVTLQRFSIIQNKTKCPFVKSSVLWGSSPHPQGSTLEDQARANVAALTEFVCQSQQSANLDGFCIELDNIMAR